MNKQPPRPLVYSKGNIAPFRFSFDSRNPEHLAFAHGNWWNEVRSRARKDIAKSAKTLSFQSWSELASYAREAYQRSREQADGVIDSHGSEPLEFSPTRSYAADWFRRYVIRPQLQRHKYPPRTPAHRKLRVEDLHIRCDYAQHEGKPVFKVSMRRRRMTKDIYAAIAGGLEFEDAADDLVGDNGDYRPRHKDRAGHYERPYSYHADELTEWLLNSMKAQGEVDPDIFDDWIFLPKELRASHRLDIKTFRYARAQLIEQGIVSDDVSSDVVNITWHNLKVVKWLIDNSCWSDQLLDRFASEVTPYIGPKDKV